MTHQLTDTKALTALDPAGPLPDWLARLNVPDAQIRDLTWTGRTDQGYWPVTVTAPAFDPATEILTEAFGSYTVDVAAKAWTAVLAKRALTPDEIAARTAALVEFVGTARWDREMAGVQFAGMLIATDDRSKTLLGGARQKADADPNYSTRWKITPTDRITISASQIIAMSNLVLDFVDAAFGADEKVTDEVINGKWKTENEIRARIWELLPENWTNGG